MPRKSYSIEHINYNGKSKVPVRMLGNSSAIKTAAIVDGKISAKNLQTHVAAQVNIPANKRMMYRVKNEIQSESILGLTKNYYLIEPWTRKFCELNPQSVCNIEWCVNRQFKRLFVMYAAADHILKHSAQLLALVVCAFMNAVNYNR